MDPDGRLNVAYVVSETQPPEVEPEIKVVVQPVKIVSTVKEVTEPVHVRPCWQRHLGLFFALLNALCFSLITVIVKKLPHIHPVGQTVWRTLVNVFICALVLLVLRWHPSTRHVRVWAGIVDADGTVQWPTVGVVIGMGLLVITGMIFRVTALEYMTIADATVVTYIAIVFVLLLAHFLLHEPCTFSKSSMAALIILGACVIARPPFLTGASNFDKNLLIGIGMKCADGAAQAGYSVSYRKWRHLHFAATLFIILIVGNVEATCAAFALRVFTLPTSIYDVVLLVTLGLLTSISQYSLALALRYETAGTVSLVRCADVPFTILWQITIFSLLPDMWSVLGTILVCTGVIMTAVIKLVSDLPSESTMRRRLRILLK